MTDLLLGITACIFCGLFITIGILELKKEKDEQI